MSLSANCLWSMLLSWHTCKLKIAFSLLWENHRSHNSEILALEIVLKSPSGKLPIVLNLVYSACAPFSCLALGLSGRGSHLYKIWRHVLLVKYLELYEYYWYYAWFLIRLLVVIATDMKPEKNYWSTHFMNFLSVLTNCKVGTNKKEGCKKGVQ